MTTTRPCSGAVETCDEIEARSYEGPIVDGRSARQVARHNSGDVILWEFHLNLASDDMHFCRFLSGVGLHGTVFNSFSTTNLRVGTRTVCTCEAKPLRARYRVRAG
eukprot:5542222-Pleurochrysis_carterae.AAC.1